MKAILEKHAARLTPEERRATWERIADPARESRPALVHTPWLVPGAAAALALAFVFAHLQRDPAEFRRPAPAPEHRAPVAAPVTPAAPRAGRSTSGDGARSVPEPAAPRVTLEPGATASRHLQPRTGHAGTPVPVAQRTLVAPPAPGQLGAITGRVLDASQQPVAYANVVVLGARVGALTDENGNYRIVGAPAGEQQVKVQAIGRDPFVAPVRVEPGRTATADLRIGEERSVKQIGEIEVRAEKRIDTRSSTTKASISAERLREIPVRSLDQATETKAGIAQGGGPHIRGGRAGEVKLQLDGREQPSVVTPGVVAPSRPAPAPPVVPTTGGTALPNDEAFDSMFFQHYGVNPFVPTDEDALSTFAVDVDAASYTLVRRYLELDQLPPADAVRVEECVNFFPQRYPKFTREDFRILVDGAPSAFGPGYHLLRVGLKGRELAPGARKRAQLTFVIDVSGSMAREDRLELVKRALRVLVDQLRADDAVGIVVFGSSARVLLEPVRLGDGGFDDGPARGLRAQRGRDRVLAAIEQLRPEGATNTEDGLRLGYDMARRAFRTGGNNRILLCSDGVANVGATGPASMLARVHSEADRGLSLTTVGFGMGNYNDVLMEQLADRGDGNHYYVDGLAEARRVFVGQADGTLQTIAKDAKVQVEFDSSRVLRWRLLGFENRDVADRDFRNDRVDAGEIGAGHEVTALYEVKLAPNVSRGTLATVRLRWAKPEHEPGGAPDVREISRHFDAAELAPRFAAAAPAFRRDAAVAEFAELLRGSYWAKEGDIAGVLAVARSAAAALNEDASDEFVRLVAKAASLRARQGREPGRREP
jgi:Ca-activated chloride channel family protein